MAVEGRLTKFLNERKWIIPVLFVLMCVLFVTTIVAAEIRRFENIDSAFAFSIGGEICAMAVAIMMTLSILPAHKRHSGYIRVFVTLLTVGCSCCFLDTIQMLIDSIPEFAVLNKIVCVLVFANETAIVFFFWLFVTYALDAKGKSAFVLTNVAFIGLAVFIVLPFVNFFYPLYFTMSDAGVYARNTQTWWICRIYLVVIAISVVILLFTSKGRLRTKIVIAVFMFLPIIALGAGGYQYGISLLYTTMMVSLVMIYTFLFSENERTLFSTSKELGLATNIQRHMLPSIFPAFPGRKEFDIYAVMHPAKEVGGDFYDFFLIDETHLCLVMADVSDKGVPAALFMMASKIMVQNYALMGYSPREVLTRVNRQICANNQDEMFVTVWLGVLNLKTGVLTAANAGHERPIIKNPDGHFEVLKDKHGFVVGWMPESVYSEYQIQLQKGAKLFVYTDGVPEARDGSGQFGMNRTLQSLVKFEERPVKEISENLLSDLYSFMGNAPQFDDITMLCLEYFGYEHDFHEVKIPADPKQINKGIEPITKFLKENGADHSLIYKMELAMEEILVNVASYAYDTGLGEIYIRYELLESPRAIQITVIDDGIPFDPLSTKDPDITASLAERKIGGLGIFITKKTMDEMKYDRRRNQNVLIMKKLF